MLSWFLSCLCGAVVITAILYMRNDLAFKN